MANIKKRLDNLEQQSDGGSQVRVFVNWSSDDDTVLINGQRMSKADFDALYPDVVVVNWDDEPDISQLA